MFSKACEYAIRSSIYIAGQSLQNKKVGLKDVAKAIESPEAYTSKILQKLNRKSLIQSVKGPNGGFYMNEGNLSSSLSDIVRAIDGEGIYSDCVLGLKACSEKNPCPVHSEFKEIKKNLIRMLESNTISEFNDKLDSGKFFLKNSTAF